MRVAVFGAGVIGKLRCATVIDNAETTLSAVADVDSDRARAAAGSSGARIFTDHRDVLSAGQVEMAIVSTPVHFHEEQCLAAFRAGCHVLCEKPLSNSLASCRRILKAATSAGRCLAVGFNHRYYPSVKYLTDVVQAGTIGKIDHLRAFGGHDGQGSFRADWMYKGELSGGGTMMDVGIHMTDLVNHVGGEIVHVSGIVTGGVWNVPGSEDNAMVVMRTSRDIPVVLQATWTEWKGYRIFLEAYGDLGMVQAYYAPMRNILITHERPGARRKRRFKVYPEIIVREKLKGWESTTRGTFEEELSDFLKMIAGEKVRLADGQAGVLAVEVADAVYRSSRERRAVTLPLD
jgi:predicted dehydrogenase